MPLLLYAIPHSLAIGIVYNDTFSAWGRFFCPQDSPFVHRSVPFPAAKEKAISKMKEQNAQDKFSG